jgi:hypothetical protein
VIFKHPYLTHTKSDFRNFSAMNSTLHFLHIYHLDFHLKKNILPLNFEKILWSNKFLKVPPCRNYFLWKSRWHLLHMRPLALNLDYTAFPFLHFGQLLAYQLNFYWISKHWKQPWLPTKKALSSPSIVIILQFMWSLWLRFFLHKISIVRIQNLIVGSRETSFHFDH